MKYTQYYQPQRASIVTKQTHPRRHWAKAMRPISIGLLAIAIVYLALLPLRAKAFDSHAWTKSQASTVTLLNQAIAKQPYKIGIAITNIRTGETVTVGSTNAFTAASTTKLITAATYYHMVESGEASLTQTIGAWPASQQLKYLINMSDNDSWAELRTVATDQESLAFLHSHGLDYTPSQNSITPDEMSRFLSALYSGKLLNPADTATMLGLMQNTNMEQMLPAVTPSSLTLYHKYGLYDGALNDVGILTDGHTSYAISVYTQNSTDSDDIARIVEIRSLAASMISHLYPGTQPLHPATPDAVDD